MVVTWRLNVPAKPLSAQAVSLRNLTALARALTRGTYPGSATYPAIGGGADALVPGTPIYPLQSIPGGGTRLFPGSGDDISAGAATNSTLIATVI